MNSSRLAISDCSSSYDAQIREETNASEKRLNKKSALVKPWTLIFFFFFFFLHRVIVVKGCVCVVVVVFSPPIIGFYFRSTRCVGFSCAFKFSREYLTNYKAYVVT